LQAGYDVIVISPPGGVSRKCGYISYYLPIVSVDIDSCDTEVDNIDDFPLLSHDDQCTGQHVGLRTNLYPVTLLQLIN